MATYDWGVDRSFKAAMDLSACQYRFVAAGSVAGEVTGLVTVGAQSIGVLQNKPRSGEEATVRVLGFSKVCSDSSSNPTWGAFVQSSSTGMALGYGAAQAASKFSTGVMMDTTVTTGSSTMVEIFVTQPALRSY
jgi:hypothetical protein